MMQTYLGLGFETSDFLPELFTASSEAFIVAYTFSIKKKVPTVSIQLIHRTYL